MPAPVIESPIQHRVLFVCTSTSESSWGTKTGIWLEEVSTPFYIFQLAGYGIDICSIKGGEPSIDPSALSLLSHYDSEDEDQTNSTIATAKKFLSDVKTKFSNTNLRSLMSIVQSGDILKYCAIYLVGGHGCVDDYPNNLNIKEAVETVYNISKGCIGAVCHGPLGLLNCRDTANKLILKDKFVAGFSKEEEECLGLVDQIPIVTETALDSIGAICVPSPPWKPHVVVDGRVVTGQNPQSSSETALRMLDVLRSLGPIYSSEENVNKPWGM